MIVGFVVGLTSRLSEGNNDMKPKEFWYLVNKMNSGERLWTMRRSLVDNIRTVKMYAIFLRGRRFQFLARSFVLFATGAVCIWHEDLLRRRGV
jgi:hypothetical protein